MKDIKLHVNDVGVVLSYFCRPSVNGFTPQLTKYTGETISLYLKWMVQSTRSASKLLDLFSFLGAGRF